MAGKTRRTKPDVGSCTEKAPGVWRLRVFAGRSTEGKAVYRERTFRGTQGEAWFALDQLVQEIDAQSSVDPTSFSKVLDDWLKLKQREGRSPTTIQGYKVNIGKHIKPALGSKRVEDIRGRDIDQLYDVLVDSGLSPSTVRQVHAVIRNALAQAVKWDLIAANPALAASPPSLVRKDPDPPSVEQIKRAIAALEGHPDLAMFVRLAAATGARRGEVCALRWSDFDIDGIDPVVVMSRSAFDVPGKAVGVKGTKTGKSKRLALGASTVEHLRAHRERQRERAVRDGVPLVDDPYIFPGTPDGSEPWRPQRVTLAWKRLRPKMGLPDTVQLKDLRHAMATRMIAAGDDVRTVAGRLGHADPSTTLRFYAAFVPERDRAAADRIDGELG